MGLGLILVAVAAVTVVGAVVVAVAAVAAVAEAVLALLAAAVVVASAVVVVEGCAQMVSIEQREAARLSERRSAGRWATASASRVGSSTVGKASWRR